MENHNFRWLPGCAVEFFLPVIADMARIQHKESKPGGLLSFLLNET